MIDFLISIRIPLIALQVLISPLLIGLILLQSGKSDDLGSALGAGGGGGGSVSGTGGTSKVLVKATVIFVIIFMLNSIVLAKIYKEITASSIGTSIAEPLAPLGGTVLPTEEERPASPELESQ
jgi:preprotein translocase subunit SecG